MGSEQRNATNRNVMKDMDKKQIERLERVFDRMLVPDGWASMPSGSVVLQRTPGPGSAKEHNE
jgi:hypothetical protein